MHVEHLSIILGLLLVASTVAVATRSFIRIPYTVALVLAGLMIGFTNFFEALNFPSLHLSKDLILFLFLPPLLFEGGLGMDLDILLRNGLGVFLLALVGTVVTMMLLGVFIHYTVGFGWGVAFLTGAILSPTDPVSVLALFREQGVDKDLSMLVEGESVFNDGLGVVLYLIVLQASTGSHVSFGHSTQMFFWEVLVGAGTGIAMGYLCHRILGRIDDHLIEVTVSIMLAFGAYLIADRFHASGVIAVVMAGIIIGSYGKLFSMSPGTRLALTHFWEVIVFIINSLLFLLIGIDLESPNLVYHASTIVMVFAFMMAVRLLLTLGFGVIMRAVRRPWPMSWQMVITWGGLRGSIPIALTLGLPVNYPHRLDMVSIIFGVVLLSLLVEGLTFKELLRILQLGRPSAEELEMEDLCGRLMGVNASIVALRKGREEGILPLALYTSRLHQLEEYRSQLDKALEKIFVVHPELRDSYLNQLDRDLIRSRLAALDEGLRKGVLREETVDRLAHELETCLLEPEPCREYKGPGLMIKGKKER